MNKTTIILATLCLAMITTPAAQAQACERFDPNGQVGIYEGVPYADYMILDCKMTPIHLKSGNVPEE